MIEMIVATGLDGAIGKDNKLLWHLKDDMKHFVKITKGRNIVMGSKTFDSLPNKPLKGRHNYVITNKSIGSFKYEDGTKLTFLTFDEFMELGLDDYVVIGGRQIYELFIAFVSTIHLTLVYSVFPEADTHFPDEIPWEFKTEADEFFPIDCDNDYPFHIMKLNRH